ncbi:hypothetical protein ACET3Z_006902 [Daucus carota]
MCLDNKERKKKREVQQPQQRAERGVSPAAAVKLTAESSGGDKQPVTAASAAQGKGRISDSSFCFLHLPISDKNINGSLQ